jgi:hypothetical protein
VNVVQPQVVVDMIQMSHPDKNSGVGKVVEVGMVGSFVG